MGPPRIREIWLPSKRSARAGASSLAVGYPPAHAVSPPYNNCRLRPSSRCAGNPIALSTWIASAEPCGSWIGVGCTTAGSVVSLALNSSSGSGLSLGSLPTQLGSLSSLTALQLSSVGLAGPLVSSLGSLSNLVSLDLSYSSLSGEIPSELYSMTSLTSLTLLTGALTGTLSSRIGLLSQLARLWVSWQSLQNTLPSELASLSNLTHLDMTSNPFWGTLPGFLQRMTALEYLGLGRASLTGTLFSELGELSRLTALVLNINSISGSVPPSMWPGLTNLANLDLSNLALAGPFFTPQFFAAGLSSLAQLRIYQSRIDGTLPASLASLSNLIDVRWYSSGLSGTIPSECETAPSRLRDCCLCELWRCICWARIPRLSPRAQHPNSSRILALLFSSLLRGEAVQTPAPRLEPDIHQRHDPLCPNLICRSAYHHFNRLNCGKVKDELLAAGKDTGMGAVTSAVATKVIAH